jgi:hypothetical protein
MCSIGSTRRKSREVARSTNRGSVPGIAVAAGNIGALALLVPIGILLLVFAASFAPVWPSASASAERSSSK